MKGINAVVTNDAIDIAPPLVAFIMLALAFSTFTYDRLFGQVLELVNMGLPAGGSYVYIAISLAVIPLAFLRVWKNGLVKAVTYLAWALYLPSVIYYCGIDPFKILDFSMNFGLFSTQLSPVAVAVAGLALACGSLTARSFMFIRSARDNFVGRGADKKEVYPVLYRNAVFEMKIILASAAAVLLIMVGVPAVEQHILGVLKATGFVYILAGLLAVVILALVFLVYLWPSKKSEKG